MSNSITDYGRKLNEEAKAQADAREKAEAFFGKGYQKRWRVPAARKPTCAHCGRLYGNRDTVWTVTNYAIGDPIPPYAGNALLIEERVDVGLVAGPNEQPGARVQRVTWDGETYLSGYDPFCTATCATSFAKLAYKAGYRVKS